MSIIGISNFPSSFVATQEPVSKFVNWPSPTRWNAAEVMEDELMQVDGYKNGLNLDNVLKVILAVSNCRM